MRQLSALWLVGESDAPTTAMTLGRSSRSRSMSRSATGRPVTSVFTEPPGSWRKSDGASGRIVSSGSMAFEASIDRMESVGERLRARAAAHPDRDFLWCDDQRWTYAETDRRTDAVAAGLAEAGVEHGDRVAVISSNRPEMLELFFALAKLGAIHVPLNVFLKGDFLRYQLQDSQASTLVADAAGLQAVNAVIDDLPELKRIVVLDDADGDAIPYARLRTSRAPVPQPELTQASLMAIMYTSGTTGMPKGCMLPHGWYLNTPKSSKHMMGYGDGDVLETALPLFHAWAQGMVMGALYNGLRAVIETQFSPATVVQRWKETGATVYAGVGMMGR